MSDLYRTNVQEMRFEMDLRNGCTLLKHIIQIITYLPNLINPVIYTENDPGDQRRLHHPSVARPSKFRRQDASLLESQNLKFQGQESSKKGGDLINSDTHTHY